MSLISIDIQCGVCDIVQDTLVERPAADYNLPCYVCESCGGEAFRVLSIPHGLRASHPDGYRRGPGYEALKLAARLKSDRANMPNTDKARADINKEIRSVEKASLKGSIKKEKGQ